MSDPQNTRFTAELSGFRKLVADANAYRLILSGPDGRVYLNLSLLVAAILTLFAPKIVLLVAVIALIRRVTVRIVSPTEKPKNKVEHVTV